MRVVDGDITATGPHATLLVDYPNDDVVHAFNHVLMPGFVNAHTHTYGVLAHGIPLANAPSGFWSFLDDFWWPKIEDVLDHDMIVAATDWACYEMLRSGVTSFYDILEAPFAIPDALLAQKELVEARGLRGLLSFEATERVSAANGQLGLLENRRLIEACRHDASLVGGLMCYHTTFTCSAPFIEQAFALGHELGVNVHAHCNEGTHEAQWCLDNIGQRTVEYYDTLGVLSNRFLASQCVQLSERERMLLATHDVQCVHMPLANCEVGGGIAPVPELLALGTNVALGSDGYINDFFEVMRGAFLLHKGRLCDPGVMPAATVLYMATEAGAHALGFNRVGRLEPGWAADLQLVDARFPTPVHSHNLYDQLVLYRNHTHVTDVMVAGKWRVRNREVLALDTEVMRARVHEQAERLWASA